MSSLGPGASELIRKQRMRLEAVLNEVTACQPGDALEVRPAPGFSGIGAQTFLVRVVGPGRPTRTLAGVPLSWIYDRDWADPKWREGLAMDMALMLGRAGRSPEAAGL